MGFYQYSGATIQSDVAVRVVSNYLTATNCKI